MRAREKALLGVFLEERKEPLAGRSPRAMRLDLAQNVPEPKVTAAPEPDVGSARVKCLRGDREYVGYGGQSADEDAVLPVVLDAQLDEAAMHPRARPLVAIHEVDPHLFHALKLAESIQHGAHAAPVRADLILGHAPPLGPAVRKTERDKPVRRLPRPPAVRSRASRRSLGGMEYWALTAHGAPCESETLELVVQLL